MLLLIIYVMEGVKTFEAIFNNLGPMQSNQDAFVTSTLDKYLLLNELFTYEMVKFISSLNLESTKL